MNPDFKILALIVLGGFALYEIFMANAGSGVALQPSTSTQPIGGLNLGINVASLQPVNASASGVYQGTPSPLVTVSGSTAAPVSPGQTIFGEGFGL
jgi:hypothetical protein